MKFGGQKYRVTGGANIGRKTTRVYVCERCGLWHVDKKPDKCLSCGWVAFMFFASKAEAERYAALLLQLTTGMISGLQRQVRYALLAAGPGGLTAVFAHYVADFVYIRDGQTIIEDVKSKRLITPDAALKIKCMTAMGYTVKLIGK